MTSHYLKSWPEFFEDVYYNRKNFELRRNDRDFKIDDLLVLQEWQPNTIDYREGSYTGRECYRTVSYVMEGTGSVGVIEPLKGLARGYAILGLISQ